MPLYLTKNYSSIRNRKIHEYEYKKFLKTLEINSIKSSKEKFFKPQSIYFNNNYLFERQINLQYRQNKRKHEYERIQKENIRFSRKLINAKTCLNRSEQEKFFDKHCKLKQHLQHYPDYILQNQTKKSHLQYPLKKSVKIINKPMNSTCSMYNNKLKEKHSKDLLVNINKLDITQKKLPRFIKHNSQMSRILPPITSIIQKTEKPTSISKPKQNSFRNNASVTPYSNIINWNKSTNTDTIKSSSLPIKNQTIKSIISSSSSSSCESNLSDLLV